MVKCSSDLGHQNCRSSLEIDARLAGGRLIAAIVNSYVDFEDYDNVIKTYIDERFGTRINPGVYKESLLYVRNNNVKLADDLIQIGTTRNLQFYSIENKDNDFFIADMDTYASVLLKMEAREDTYERTVFSFFDLTGLVGGVFEILEITGGVFVSIFAHRLFMFSMLNDLYQVQKNDSNIDSSKIVPRVRQSRIRRMRTKGDPKLYEETKLPNKNDKRATFKLQSSKIDEILQMQVSTKPK